MTAYYTYLISSLPVLNLFAKAPFSLKDFFTKCKNLIPDKELEILYAAVDQDSYSLAGHNSGSVAQWANFEVTLRNELVRARASRKKIDPSKFLRFPDSPQAEIVHVAMTAYRSTSILEAEKILDQARWNFLENLSFGHYFDFESLLVYGLKLKILERWDKIQNANKEQLLNMVV
ncbi:MAG: DUF2764 family protein [Candidatus Omnitrophica bacterium]|nr:DUF2764 family protein [Candidatus Omnitrophota bacterium]